MTINPNVLNVEVLKANIDELIKLMGIFRQLNLLNHDFRTEAAFILDDMHSKINKRAQHVLIQYHKISLDVEAASTLDFMRIAHEHAELIDMLYFKYNIHELMKD